MTQHDLPLLADRHSLESSGCSPIHRRRLTAAGVSLLLLLPQSWAGAHENWPRFRGPQADGVATDNDRLPMLWTQTKNVKWVADVPGWGWSSPVVWGDRVFLTAVVSEEENQTPSKGLYLGEGVRDPAKGMHHWMVYCFDLNTGEELWKHAAHAGRPVVPRHPKSSYAAETPTTDGKRLYALFGDLGLYCYDMDGNLLWSQMIEPKKTFYDYGAAASPVVHDGQVIVVYDNLEQSWIASFDAETGDERWRTLRDETHSWATPFVWQNELRTEIVVPGKNRNRSYSLDGQLLWEFDGQMSNLVIPSPFAAHGMCYIASGYIGDAHRPTFAVRAGASGDITPEGDFADSPFIEWHQGRASPYNTTQIVYGDYLYTLYDQGFLTCHDAKTGNDVYGKRRFSPGGSFTSSPWAYNGYVFCLSEDGLTYVVKSGPTFEVVARNELDELCLATPAIVDEKLLIRTASKLYCLTGGRSSQELEQANAASNVTPAIDIWTAVREGNRRAVIDNLESDAAAVDAKDSQGGLTLLSMAALFGQTEIAKLLLENGVDVALQNNDGNTPLHVASFVADPDLVKLLLRHGAPADKENKRGETPLDVVSAAWSAELEGFYQLIGNFLGKEFDLEQIKRNRPKVADILRNHATETEDDEAGANISDEPAAKANAAKVHRVAAVTAEDWATYNYNVAGWRHNAQEETLRPDNIDRLSLKWQFPQERSDDKVGVIHATPAVVDGYVYFGTATYPAFYCLSPPGKVVWKHAIGGAGLRPGSEREQARGLNPQDGILTSALVTDDAVYFGDVAGVMHCLDRATGAEIWQVDSRASRFPGAHHANVVIGSPIFADENVVFGGGAYEHAHPLNKEYKCCYGRGFVVALNPHSGDVVWKYDVGPQPEQFDPPLVVEDEYGKHVFHYGPSTSSVWCTPSWDENSNTVFFGTDIHNSPRKPTQNDPRNYTKHSAAVIAVDAADGSERWVTQLAAGDVWNHTMSPYERKAGLYKDLSVGDTPKLYTIEMDGKTMSVVGVGCKNGGFYVLDRETGEILAHSPVYTDPPAMNPQVDPRTLALPSPIGGLQTGCATDGRRVYTNGIDRLPNVDYQNWWKPNPPTGGRVTAISLDTKTEFWRHERPTIDQIGGTSDEPLFSNCGDPVASGIAVANGLVFCTTFSSNKLLCIDAQSGKLLKEFSIGPVLSGPSVSRGQVYVGTGNMLFSDSPGEAFFPKKYTGKLLVFGL